MSGERGEHCSMGAIYIVCSENGGCTALCHVFCHSTPFAVLFSSVVLSCVFGYSARMDKTLVSAAVFNVPMDGPDLIWQKAVGASWPSNSGCNGSLCLCLFSGGQKD